MVKIGLLSDTHGYFDPGLVEFFKECDEIWHAGDIGSYEVIELIRKNWPLKAVYGNIDNQDVRKEFPKNQRFLCEGLDVWITHIGGYPKKYDPQVKQSLKNNPPGLFICGHSHILKVIYDHEFNLLHINPGAAGKFGLHQVRTA